MCDFTLGSTWTVTYVNTLQRTVNNMEYKQTLSHTFKTSNYWSNLIFLFSSSESMHQTAVGFLCTIVSPTYLSLGTTSIRHTNGPSYTTVTMAAVLHIISTENCTTWVSNLCVIGIELEDDCIINKMVSITIIIIAGDYVGIFTSDDNI